MGKRSAKERPSLDCPECSEPLIPAHGRGRFDRDGNEIMHADECRCRWCDWWWTGGDAPVACACGALVGVDADDGVAFAVIVKPEATP